MATEGERTMQTNILCFRTLGVAALVTLLQSCGSPKSSSTGGPAGGPVPTSRMTIDLKVESSEPGIAVVRANLNDGHALGESYRLDGGDFLRACVIGTCRTMADNNSVFEPDYIARFDFRPGVDYVVSFNRRKAQDAPNSRVVLPPAFTLVTPANFQQVTDGDTVVVEWSPTGAPARVEVKFLADCTQSFGPNSITVGTAGTDPDADGRESVSIDDILEYAGSSSPQSRITRCDIDLTVRHELQGRIDPGFGDGTAIGVVSRKVTLDYVPR
jgi:hypothetical protein